MIHCAAQPSHDKAKEIPYLDFDVNAGGTMNMLEATRRFAPEAVFCHMSTNKVYGDAPNEVPLKSSIHVGICQPGRLAWHQRELPHRSTTHSLFGASKTAADVIAQEYGRYFDMKVGVFRGGCLTGASHSGVELHGFLSYLVHVAVYDKPTRIFGYKGKQVRDQIESTDVIRAFEAFAKNPRAGEVYNLGGGRDNAASVLECIALIEELSPYRVRHSLSDTNRVGDHICYISDLRKLKSHFPGLASDDEPERYHRHHDRDGSLKEEILRVIKNRRVSEVKREGPKRSRLICARVLRNGELLGTSPR